MHRDQNPVLEENLVYLYGSTDGRYEYWLNETVAEELLHNKVVVSKITHKKNKMAADFIKLLRHLFAESDSHAHLARVLDILSRLE